MTPEQTDLAKQLVALGQKDERYFRWMPGMLMSSGRAAFLLRNELAAVSNGGGIREIGTQDTPRITDPATAGCLFHIWTGLFSADGSCGLEFMAVGEDEQPYLAEDSNSTCAYGKSPGVVMAKAIAAIAEAEGVTL